MKKNPWIDEISKIADINKRRFEPKKDNINNCWSIQLMPAFEFKVKSKSNIPSDIKGIYRYNRKGEVVYIGSGNIKERCSSSDRNDWEYDLIEYSIIEDIADREKWETFWLNDFKENYGTFPLYNKIGGKTKH